MKLSPIFPGHIKPCKDRPGVYQRKYKYGWIFCWWNGAEFGYAFFTAKNAYLHVMLLGASVHQSLPWRGVASKDGL